MIVCSSINSEIEFKQVDASPFKFRIFRGDVNQEGYINLTDIIAVFKRVFCYRKQSTGYCGRQKL